MAHPRFQRARAHRMGGVAITARTSTTFVDLDNTADSVLEAQVGDTIIVNAAIYLSNEATRVWVDVGTFVDPNFTHFGSTSDGSFFGPLTSTEFQQLSLFARRVMTTTDVVDGEVTIRWRYKVSGSKTFGIAYFVVQNIGPADPE